MLFLRVLAQRETQTPLSKMWTQMADSISYNNNYYTKITSLSIYIYIDMRVECLPVIQETRVQSQIKSYQRLKKLVLDTSLLNTQHYKVQIKGKWNNSGKGVASSPIPWCSSYLKGAFRLPNIIIYILFVYKWYIDLL